MFLKNFDKAKKFFLNLAASRFSYSFLFLYTVLYFAVLCVVFHYWQDVDTIAVLQTEVQSLKLALHDSNVKMLSLVENLEKYEDSIDDILNESGEEVGDGDEFNIIPQLRVLFHLGAFLTTFVLFIKSL